MASSTTDSVSHSHGLHVVIPTTSAARVPSASTPKTSTAERVAGPNPLDTPGHSHPFFALPRAADSPSTPKMSARAARRSSLFSMHDADEPEQDAMADANAQPEHIQQVFALPPTSEADEEDSSVDLADLKVLGDMPLHVEGNGTGGNN